MHSKIVTTITTLIDLDTFEPDHSVAIDADGELPTQVIYAAVQGGCNATLNSLRNQGHLVEDDADEA